MKKTIFLIGLFLITGCATSKYAGVINAYNQINYDDGISLEEAKTIAQSELLARQYDEWYKFFEPKSLKKIKSVPNAGDYWFITFDEKASAQIQVVYLVIVSKKNGEIVYSKRYFRGKEWVLEAHFLKMKSP